LIGGPYGKRPSALLPRLMSQLQECSSRADIRAVLSMHRYVGDLKVAAEKYGAHYLKTKKMRRREMEEWIINNHPVVRREKDSGVRG
jgi:hypothetical protein